MKNSELVNATRSFSSALQCDGRKIDSTFSSIYLNYILVEDATMHQYRAKKSFSVRYCNLTNC